MIGELDLYGVFVPALAAWALIAFIATLLMRRILAWVGFYRAVWHRPLFDLALYVLVLGAVVAIVPPFTS